MDPERLVGQTLGHYHILRQIGYGGMATVFLAQDTNLEREVAVKVFWPRPGETRDFLRRFAREARVLAQLDHPNILPVYDYGEQDGLAYLVTPYMAGGTLRDLLKVRKLLPPSEVLGLAAPILNALQYAHQRGLIHRDIKPGNMLFKADGSLVLADFGLVKVTSSHGDSGTQLDPTSQTSTAITGTPEYMSPEQIQGQATPASDIYSVGVVFYEMLAGRRPFQSDSAVGILIQQMHEQPHSLRESNPSIPPQLDMAVMHALEKDPSRRYASPADFLEALTQAAAPAIPTGLDLTGPTASMTWPASMPRPAQDSPRVPSGSYGQGQPASTGREAFFPAAPSAYTAQALPGSVTDPGQTPQAGPSTPFTPTRNYPEHSSPVQRPRSRLPLLIAALSLLVIAVSAAGLAFTPLGGQLLGHGPAQTPTPGGNRHTAQPGGSATVTSTQAVTAAPACPATGTARAAALPPVTLGSDPNIVYFVNEGTSGAPTFGTLKRYDTITGQKTEIVKMAKTSIESAQVSTDGQWILYSARVQGQEELGLARVDGHMAQTLFCAPAGSQITLPQWSEDQKLVVFDVTKATGGATLYLLNMATGSLSTELAPPVSQLSYLPRTWLDLTRVLLTGYYPNSASPQQNIYILDTNNGPNQQSSNLQLLATVGTQQNPCWDFDSSIDSSTVYIDQCNPSAASSVEAQPVIGSPAATAFSSSTLAINSVRVYDRKNAFLLATTTTGLYKIALDGSNNAIQLASVQGTQGSVGLNAYSQFSWSNVSRDASMYVLEDYSSSGGNTTYTLLYGPMSGGPTRTLASIGDGTVLKIIGWTTM